MTPSTGSQALMAAQLGQIAATPALPMLLFSRELNVGNEDLRAAFRGLLMKFQALIVAELARGQDGGFLRREVAPEDAAVLLTSLVQGMAIRWSLGARNFSLIGEGKRLLDVQLRLLTVKED
jgi:TetR/AcrR family transcriptional regulator